MEIGDRQVHKVRRSAVRSIVVLLVLLFGAAVTLSVLAWTQANPRSYWALLGFAGLAGVQVLYWLRALARARATLEVTEDAVSLAFPSELPVVLRWTEIDRVRWKWFRPDGCIELSGRDGRQVRVDLSLEDIDEILLLLSDRLREQIPSQLPLVVSSRTRAFLLAALFGLAIIMFGLAFFPGAGEPAWRVVLIGAGILLAGASSLLLLLGARRLCVDEQLISIDRFFRAEAVPITAIEEVHIGLTPGQVKAPNVEVRVGGRLRSVLYLGAEPFALFNSIRAARTQSRARPDF